MPEDNLFHSQVKNPNEVKDAVIHLKNIQKTYLLGIEGISALRGVSLEIERGEFVVVYGTSGGGKSSLLNIIGTIDRPTKGQMEMFKTPIRAKTSDDVLAKMRLKNMGFVFQTFNLLSTMSALENVEMPMILEGKLSRKQRRKRAVELLTKVGMKDRLKHVPSQLSGGEQQRVTIARAIANHPDILLMDEPTGDLDSVNTAIVMDLLHTLNTDENITLIMVTHDPLLKHAADRVIWMRDGKIDKIEKVGADERRLFWEEMKEQLPQEKEKEERKSRNQTIVRYPRNYDQLRGSLQESTQFAEDLLQQYQPDSLLTEDHSTDDITSSMLDIGPSQSINHSKDEDQIITADSTDEIRLPNSEVLIHIDEN